MSHWKELEMVARYVTCVETGDYKVSLVLNSTYETLSDNVAEKHKMIRIIDESGEDYLYPKSYFVPTDTTVKAVETGLSINN